MKPPTCFVLDHHTHRVIYKAASLAQATGFVDRRKRSSIIAVSASSFATEFLYKIAVIDTTSGQVIATGPIVELFEAADALCDLRIVILPCLKDGSECEVAE
jgi:hypothetical protein